MKLENILINEITNQKNIYKEETKRLREDFKDIFTPEELILLDEINIKKLEDLINNIATIDEKLILDSLNHMSEETKKHILEIGLSNTQIQTIQIIINKYNYMRSKYIEKFKDNKLNYIEHLEDIIKKTKGTLNKTPQENIITDFEIEKILQICDSQKLTELEKIDILKEISYINYSIYEKYDIKELNKNKKTNDTLNIEEIINLFQEYNIDFEKYNEQWKSYLIEHGNITNIREILDTLEKYPELKNITNIKKQEIFIKVLVHSNKDIIEQVINEAKNNNIYEIIFKQFTILYPTIAERTKHTFNNNTLNNNTMYSGAANYFLENIKIFKELNLNIEELYETCSSLFTKNPKTIKNAIKELKLYGIDVFNKENEFKVAISILKIINISNKMDIAIENKCFEYCKQNLSSLNLNLYKLKLAEQEFKEKNPNQEFIPYIKYKTSRLALPKEFTRSNTYGETQEETFELYDAEEPIIENKELYDGILNSFENNTISESTLNNSFIKILDNSEYYKNNYSYSFNGIIISRIKILRYIETFITLADIELNKDLIYYIITKNSMLNKEELNTIKSIINNLEIIRSNKL